MINENCENLIGGCTKRIIKPKIIYDPSDTSTVKLNGNSHDITKVVDKRIFCTICKEYVKIRERNQLIKCLKCIKLAHQDCFNSHHIKQEKFICKNCFICTFCGGVHNNTKLLTCTKCLNVYHYECDQSNNSGEFTRFDEQNKSTYCSKCSLQNQSNKLTMNDIYEIIGDNRLRVTNDNFNSDKSFASTKEELIIRCNENSKEFENVDSRYSSMYNPLEMIDIPDVRNWSINDVVQFFMKYFPNEAFIFADYEIDGNRLLSLTRQDIVCKLPIKLGPSLRLYNLILKLQNKSNDATLGWNYNI